MSTIKRTTIYNDWVMRISEQFQEKIFALKFCQEFAERSRNIEIIINIFNELLSWQALKRLLATSSTSVWGPQRGNIPVGDIRHTF